MGWPKGMPRKGHINKDGSVHARYNERKTSERISGVKTSKSIKRFKKVDPKVMDEPEAKGPVFHGAVGSSAITEPCPQCLYAYADGGYCPDCGWMRPINRLPYGTAGRGSW